MNKKIKKLQAKIAQEQAKVAKENEFYQNVLKYINDNKPSDINVTSFITLVENAITRRMGGVDNE